MSKKETGRDKRGHRRDSSRNRSRKDATGTEVAAAVAGNGRRSSRSYRDTKHKDWEASVDASDLDSTASGSSSGSGYASSGTMSTKGSWASSVLDPVTFYEQLHKEMAALRRRLDVQLKGLVAGSSHEMDHLSSQFLSLPSNTQTSQQNPSGVGHEVEDGPSLAELKKLQTVQKFRKARLKARRAAAKQKKLQHAGQPQQQPQHDERQRPQDSNQRASLQRTESERHGTMLRIMPTASSITAPVNNLTRSRTDATETTTTSSPGGGAGAASTSQSSTSFTVGNQDEPIHVDAGLVLSKSSPRPVRHSYSSPVAIDEGVEEDADTDDGIDERSYRKPTKSAKVLQLAPVMDLPEVPISAKPSLGMNRPQNGQQEKQPLAGTTEREHVARAIETFFPKDLQMSDSGDCINLEESQLERSVKSWNPTSTAAENRTNTRAVVPVAALAQDRVIKVSNANSSKTDGSRKVYDSSDGSSRPENPVLFSSKLSTSSLSRQSLRGVRLVSKSDSDDRTQADHSSRKLNSPSQADRSHAIDVQLAHSSSSSQGNALVYSRSEPQADPSHRTMQSKAASIMNSAESEVELNPFKSLPQCILYRGDAENKHSVQVTKSCSGVLRGSSVASGEPELNPFRAESTTGADSESRRNSLHMFDPFAERRRNPLSASFDAPEDARASGRHLKEHSSPDGTHLVSNLSSLGLRPDAPSLTGKGMIECTDDYTLSSDTPIMTVGSGAQTYASSQSIPKSTKTRRRYSRRYLLSPPSKEMDADTEDPLYDDVRRLQNARSLGNTKADPAARNESNCKYPSTRHTPRRDPSTSDMKCEKPDAPESTSTTRIDSSLSVASLATSLSSHRSRRVQIESDGLFQTMLPGDDESRCEIVCREKCEIIPEVLGSPGQMLTDDDGSARRVVDHALDVASSDEQKVRTTDLVILKLDQEPVPASPAESTAPAIEASTPSEMMTAAPDKEMLQSGDASRQLANCDRDQDECSHEEKKTFPSAHFKIVAELAPSRSTSLKFVSDTIVRDPYGDLGRYTGYLLEDKPHWQGSMLYDDGRSYDGEWNHGRWHGFARASFANGDTYVGQYINDKRHGAGRYCWPDGRYYSGEFQDNQRNGTGMYSWGDGSCYTGGFKDGLRHGQGCYKFSDGSFYTGEFHEGKYHGVGECIWADGRCYRGEFLEGRADGYGIEIRRDGTIRHDGEWKEDRPVRPKVSINVDMELRKSRSSNPSDVSCSIVARGSFPPAPERNYFQARAYPPPLKQRNHAFLRDDDADTDPRQLINQESKNWLKSEMRPDNPLEVTKTTDGVADPPDHRECRRRRSNHRASKSRPPAPDRFSLESSLNDSSENDDSSISSNSSASVKSSGRKQTENGMGLGASRPIADWGNSNELKSKKGPIDPSETSSNGSPPFSVIVTSCDTSEWLQDPEPTEPKPESRTHDFRGTRNCGSRWHVSDHKQVKEDRAIGVINLNRMLDLD